MNITTLGLLGIILVLAGWYMHVQVFVFLGLFLGGGAFIWFRASGGNE